MATRDQLIKQFVQAQGPRASINRPGRRRSKPKPKPAATQRQIRHRYLP